MRVLIVGAGFGGAVYARECAEANCEVVVIDQRDHVAGNAFDYVEDGVRIHKYGPHLFHTNNQRVVQWLSQFTEWVDYHHKACAKLPDGRLVPFPVNRESVEAVLGQPVSTLPLGANSTGAKTNAHRYLIEQLGEELTELFFQRYTKKMWGVSLAEMSADVVRRVKIRLDNEDRYFPDDAFQAMPAAGYTAVFENILDLPNIQLRLNCPFRREMEANFDFVFNSMAIDEYFGYKFGRLPYRSLRFHHEILDEDHSQGCVTINYTDTSPFTRETHWHNIPGHRIEPGRFVRTVEEPCSYEDNNFERYYPVKTFDDRFTKIYRKYQAEAAILADRMQFIGRCGTYQYLDMHQVIMQSLQGARHWLAGA